MRLIRDLVTVMAAVSVYVGAAISSTPIILLAGLLALVATVPGLAILHSRK